MYKIFLFISLLLILAVALLYDNTGIALGAYDKSALAADEAKGAQIAKKISSIETLAPLAPVALSPFFGITCLSGASILCSRGILPENDFLMGNKALNNGLVFIVFLALSIATSLPKMTAVSKGFAEAADRLETYAGIISYLAILYLGSAGAQTPAASAQQVIYTAGIFSFTKTSLLMLASVVNIIVINTVKFFFELLVWISPVPALDAMFESANKAITAALVTVYAFNPYLALIINLILFLICLTIFNWVRRRVRYYRAIYLGPIISRILGKTGSVPEYVKSRISAAVEQGQTLLPVFPSRRIGKIKKKEMAWLATGKDGLFLVKLRLLRQPRVVKIAAANAQIEIISGLLSNTIEIFSEEIKKAAKLTFSRVYNSRKDDFAAALKSFGKVATQAAADSAKQTGTEPQPGIA